MRRFKVFCVVYCHVCGLSKRVYRSITQIVAAFDEIDAEWTYLDWLEPSINSSVYLVEPVITQIA